MAAATGSVTGVIRDTIGTPVSGMTVQLLNSQQGVVGSASVGPQGKFQLANVGPGDYMLLMTIRGQVERRLPVHPQGQSRDQRSLHAVRRVAA